MGTVVRGSGHAVGEHVVTNDALARVCDTTDEWIRERSGIEQRYYVADGTTTSDLGVRAAQQALEHAGLKASDIDYVIFATMTPDYYFPGCGALLQSKLGMSTVPSLDIRQQCTGFIYGLQVADAMLKAKMSRRILLVGAEIHSGFMPWKDHRILWDETAPKPTPEEYAFNTKFRDRTVLFGDAGGALVLEYEEDSKNGVLDILVHSDGTNAEKLYVPSGFAFRPYITEEMVREGRHIPEMDGRSVFRSAIVKMPEVVTEILRRNGLNIDDVSLLIMHQANLRICDAVQKALKLPDDRVYNNIQRYGNTTAATIPIAYNEVRRQGRVKKGDLVCFVGLGAGFHWGAALMRE